MRFSLALPLAGLLLFTFPPRTGLSQTKPSPIEPITLSSRISQVLAHLGLKNASVGVLIRSQETGKTLFERNPDLSLMPASNLKILTALGVLQQKGADFTFPTEIYTTIPLAKDGTLSGDIYIKGSGDPSLSAERLESLVLALKAKGVKKITGRLLADAQCFTDAPLGEGWEWDDESAYYAAQVSGLCCDENVLDISVKPPLITSQLTPQITLGGKYLFPYGANAFVNVKSTITLVSGDKKKERKIVFDRVRGQNIFVLSGTMGEEASEQIGTLTVENPALFTLHRFAHLCEAQGITLSDSVSYGEEKVPVRAILLAQTRSKPLSEMVHHFLKESDNLYGECFLRSLALPNNSQNNYSQNNYSGTVIGGEKAIIALLQSQEIETTGMNIADGSGLSRHNTVTARLLNDVLLKMPLLLPKDAEQRAFQDGLPIGGVDGTLKSRFKGGKLKGKVHAKTGSLSGASSLSGYVTDTKGKNWVFSILLNHYDHLQGAALAHTLQDQIIELLAQN